jgi:hypothetical protein
MGFMESFENFATGVEQIIDAGDRVVALAWIGGGAELVVRM